MTIKNVNSAWIFDIKKLLNLFGVSVVLLY